MLRKRFEWKIKSGSIQMGDRTLIMGILNVTPDSFSDGGKYHDPDRAYARALELEEQGVDVIDIGAESTRPGSERVSEAEELRRLIPVLKRLKEKLNVPISVDTYKAAVAEKALEHGADIINDPTGLTWDAELAKVVVKYNAGLILNHMRGTPETWAKLPPLPNVAAVVAAELQSAVHRAVRAGVETERLVIDPGLGFGKRREQNATLLARLPMIARLNLPILVGPSRKAFLARASEEETSYANAAAVTAAILGGAHMVRVHEPASMRAAAQIADLVLIELSLEAEAAAAEKAAQRRPAREPEPDRETPKTRREPNVGRYPTKEASEPKRDAPQRSYPPRSPGGPGREFDRKTGPGDRRPPSPGDRRPPSRNFDDRRPGNRRPGPPPRGPKDRGRPPRGPHDRRD